MRTKRTLPLALLFLANQDPKPSGKKWVSVDGLSEEFDGNGLDANK